MKTIQGIDKITHQYAAWRASDIAFIKALEWSNSNLLLNCYCQLRVCVAMWPDVSQEFFEVEVLFKNIRNLKLSIPGTGLHQIVGFDIIDVSANGLEGINYQINDYEGGSIEFSCESIEIIAVTNPVHI